MTVFYAAMAVLVLIILAAVVFQSWSIDAVLRLSAYFH